MKSFFVLIFLFFYRSKEVTSIPVQPKLDDENIIRAHLKYPHVQKMCKEINKICNYKDRNVCALRHDTKKWEFRDFENDCQVFLVNMCEFPDREFHILMATDCASYIAQRRSQGESVIPTVVDVVKTDPTKVEAGDDEQREGEVSGPGQEEVAQEEIEPTNNEIEEKNTDNEEEKESEKPVEEVTEGDPNDNNTEVTETNNEETTLVDDPDLDNNNVTGNLTGLRMDSPTAKPFKQLHKRLETYDGHICPMSCPPVYNPVCITANRNEGKHMKTLTFINQCLGYIYYCDHPEFFTPPPESDYSSPEERISHSLLSWSFCGHSKFLQFARFSEVASAMNHYGWLHGHFRTTKILEPWERTPGFG